MPVYYRYSDNGCVLQEINSKIKTMKIGKQNLKVEKGDGKPDAKSNTRAEKPDRSEKIGNYWKEYLFMGATWALICAHAQILKGVIALLAQFSKIKKK